MPQTQVSTEDQLRATKSQLRKLKKVLAESRDARRVQEEYMRAENVRLRTQIADTSDKTLPAKTALLKELAYLVQATSRAVRTTMWSLAPTERRGGR